MTSIDTALFSDLVGAIYDSAIDAARWPDSLARLQAQLGFTYTSLALHSVSPVRSLLNITAGMSQADRDQMLALEPDVVDLWGGREAAMARPIDRPWICSHLLSREQIEATRYYREWARPRGLIDSAMVVLARDPSLVGSIGMGRHRDQGPISAETIALAQQFLPHLQRAVRINGLLEASLEASHRFEAVIDFLATPVILLTGDLSIVHANLAANALLESGQPLAARDGALCSEVPGLQRALANLVARAVLDETLTPGAGIGLPCRTDGDQAFTLHIIPLARGALRPHLAQGATAALFVSSAAVTHDLDLDLLAPLFDLTPAEIRVFNLIAGGRTPQEIAIEIGVAVSTVRTHLLRVFEKTGINRQADLIRMATSLASPLFTPPIINARSGG